MTAAPRPVLKWAGGKSRSLSYILSHLPDRIDTYYEPFAGGAAVFFSLAAAGRFRRAVLSDLNRELLGVYRALKKDVEGVIRILRGYSYDEHEYYRVRDLDPADLDLLECAARVIYLNKTGYNGLYRVNRAGRFNVPFGRHKDPKICDADNLRAAATALKRARLDVCDFERSCARARPGDAVYFDPPYVPVSRTASFTSYHHVEFGEGEQARLAGAFAELAERGVTAVLSNSDTALSRRLYAGWPTRTIAVSRPINSKSAKRGSVSELLVFTSPAAQSTPRPTPRMKTAGTSRRR